MSEVSRIENSIRSAKKDYDRYKQSLNNVNKMVPYLENAYENIVVIEQRIKNNFLIDNKGAEIEDIIKTKQKILDAKNNLTNTVIPSIDKTMKNINSKVSSLNSQKSSAQRREKEKEKEKESRQVME